MKGDLDQLIERARHATGRDTALDRALDETLGAGASGEAPAYTGSVDACIELVHRMLPGWAWHVGYGAEGVIPYAAVSHGPARHEASAPTVPLALLLALLRAKAGQEG